MTATHAGSVAVMSQHWIVNLRGLVPAMVIEISHLLPLPGRNSRNMLRENGSLGVAILTSLVVLGEKEDQFRRSLNA